jgi:outer membrane protein assembly factor BamD (BamD/ComL family)
VHEGDQMSRYLSRASLIARVTLVTLVLAIASQAQHEGINEDLKTDEELLLTAEAALKVLASQQPQDMRIARKVESDLTRILQRNPTTYWRQRIEVDFVKVQEILADRNLLVAQFYFDARHRIVQGAQPRLLEITRSYPGFSRMDEVLLLLATVAIKDERPDDAATYLWKLVCRYPTSSKRPLAFQKLEEVGYRSWQGCDNFEQ